MTTTALPSRALVQSRIAAIMLAGGASLAIFGLFGLSRGFIFSGAGDHGGAGIRPRALTEMPQSIETPMPATAQEWPVATATGGVVESAPVVADLQGSNHDIPGCGTEADGVIRCWGGATPAPWALIPGDVWEDETGRHVVGTGTGMIVHPTATPVPVRKSGFRTGSGLRKGK
ncbi:MAG TPA: hypothetical protein PKD12_15600 [Nitrospira sp.]|nr:hypothetical protein [Nitrospira sp.]